MSNDTWKIFDLPHLMTGLGEEPVQYREFLKVPALTCALYRLAAGARDMQAPHDEDEVYYVLSGKAKMRLGGIERTVGPGSLLYVGATEKHSFFEIEEDMTLLVFFAASGR